MFGVVVFSAFSRLEQFGKPRVRFGGANGAKKEPKESSRKPKGAKREAEGAKREPKGGAGSQNGAKREPKGSQKGAK